MIVNAPRECCALLFSLGLIAGLGACADQDDGDDGGADAYCIDDGDCLNGQFCDAGACVPLGNDPTNGNVSAGGPSGGDPSGGDPSGGDPSGGDPSGGDPSGGDPSGGDPSGGDPSGGDPSGSPSPSCDEGSFACVDSNIEACEDGQIQTYSCGDVCGSQGWTTAGCDGDQCSCDGYLDADCAVGVSAFCTCLEGAGESCTEQDMQDLYLDCYLGNAPEFACFANYVSNNQVDCVSAVDACL